MNNLMLLILKATFVESGASVRPPSPSYFMAPSTVSTVPLRDDASVPDPTSLQEQVVQVL